MKQIKSTTIIAGLMASVFAVSAHAAPFSPMAVDRYSVSSFTQDKVVEKTEFVEFHIDAEPRQVFQPFVANSYKASPFKFKSEAIAVKSDVKAALFDDSKANGFKSFSAKRYH